MLIRALTRLCQANHKEVYLQNQAKRIGKWKFQQHSKQAQATAKLRACYNLGLQDLVRSGALSNEESEKWAIINSKMFSLQGDTKSLLWYGRRRISREYAASPDGLGKTPKESTD
jgi:hypothetical protein